MKQETAQLFLIASISFYLITLIISAIIISTNFWIKQHTAPKVLRYNIVAILILGIIDIITWMVISLASSPENFIHNYNYGVSIDVIFSCSILSIGDCLSRPKDFGCKLILFNSIPTILIVFIPDIFNFQYSNEIKYIYLFIFTSIILSLQLKAIRKHDIELKQNYIDIDSRRHIWYVKIVGSLLGLLIAYSIIAIIIDYYSSIIPDIRLILIALYDISAAIVWIWLTHFIIQLKNDEDYNCNDNDENKSHDNDNNDDTDNTHNRPFSEAKWVERLNILMENEDIYLDSDLTKTKLANLVGTNRTYLSNYLKYELNTNFYDYINDKRIAHITKLMKDPSLTLATIATMSGFNDMRTFRRLFSERFGCTPTEYRSSLSDWK
ncbi:MAG: helix-turn-helix domain-containing protein [Bacteroidaceae bacterium]|nr:helix-turn-helix domain-containing protein [Bacteroidaceae bacterium]